MAEDASPIASVTETDDDALLARLHDHIAEIQQRPRQQVQQWEASTPDLPKEEWWSVRSAITMCSLVLVFGFVIVLISSGLALKRIEKDTIMKVVVIPMAVMLAVFLVVAGYSDSQIAPVMGLLGTIVGYVLGTSRKPESEPSRNE